MEVKFIIVDVRAGAGTQQVQAFPLINKDLVMKFRNLKYELTDTVIKYF